MGDYTVMRKGTTVLEYAHKVRGGHIIHLAGFKINGGTQIYPPEKVNTVLADGDNVELLIDDKSDVINITPIWLKGQSDPRLLELVSAQLKKGLQFWEQQGSSSSDVWISQIEQIGLEKLESRLQNRPIIVGIAIIAPYYESLGIRNAHTLLRSIAYGEITDVALDAMAEYIDEFTENNIILDFELRNDKEKDMFEACCKINAFSYSELRDERGKKYMRYFFPKKNITGLYQLFTELSQQHGLYQRGRLITKVTLLYEHLPHSDIQIYQRVYNDLSKFKTRKSDVVKKERTIGLPLNFDESDRKKKIPKRKGRYRRRRERWMKRGRG